MAFNWDEFERQTGGPIAPQVGNLVPNPGLFVPTPGFTPPAGTTPIAPSPAKPAVGAPAPPASTDFGNLADPAAWMALVGDPTKLRAWVKQNNPGWADQLVDYYTKVIQGQPGANPTEQAGSAQYYIGKFKADPFYGGQVGAGGGYAAPGFGDLGQMDTAQWGLPTAEQTRNTPGYQYAQQMAQQGIERSAAAKGTLLTGGTLRRLQENAIGLGDQQYMGLANLGLNQFQTNYNVRRGERGDLWGRYKDTAVLGKPE